MKELQVTYTIGCNKNGIEHVKYEIRMNKAWYLSHTSEAIFPKIAEYIHEGKEEIVITEYAANNAVVKSLLDALGDMSKVNTGMTEPNFYALILLKALLGMWD